MTYRIFDSPAYLHCPECEEAAIPELNNQRGAGWSEDQDSVECPGCGRWLRVDITYDVFEGQKVEAVVEGRTIKKAERHSHGHRIDESCDRCDESTPRKEWVSRYHYPQPERSESSRGETNEAKKYDDGKPKLDLLFGPAAIEISRALNHLPEDVSLSGFAVECWARWLCGQDETPDFQIHPLAFAGACAVKVFAESPMPINPMALLCTAGIPIAEALTYGGVKYEDDFNYLRGSGLSFRRVGASGLRHWASEIRGETTDPESKLPHVGHAGACAVMALNLVLLKKGIDDRIHRLPGVSRD